MRNAGSFFPVDLRFFPVIRLTIAETGSKLTACTTNIFSAFSRLSGTSDYPFDSRRSAWLLRRAEIRQMWSFIARLSGQSLIYRRHSAKRPYWRQRDDQRRKQTSDDPGPDCCADVKLGCQPS